ncbi:alpha/beta fold hydrolase [Pseudonocardia sp.]|uniref:alpha/beta fold hydrolase n=1 Tax=Pseudonocardia sp. TaxID=60912 RepID=UPI003D0FF3CC
MSTLVLVPGAGGTAWYWHRLVPELAARGHTAVPVELPAADDSAGLAEYADAIVEAARDLQDVVLVAQSFGGMSAPLVCARRPVRGLIMLNAMVPRPGETPGEWWGNTGHAAARLAQARAAGRSEESLADLVDAFFHDVPPEITAEAFAQGEPVQSDTPLAKPWPLPAWPDVPLEIIHGREDRFFPLEFAERVAAERLGSPLRVIPGGHLVALSRPAELADAIDDVITRHGW